MNEKPTLQPRGDLDPATRAQVDAADPSGSVWLAANAGSGKTRVLTDRVAWLLLQGTPPDRILCLTFTKAAAGEMQNRLFGTLGKWAMLPDADLRAALRRLGVATAMLDDPGAMRRARTLFAAAIETPGGLKIQTLHAFCAALLRRFPLEAGISPSFSEMDDIASARLMIETLDAMAEDPSDAPLVEALAARLTTAEPEKWLAGLYALRDTFRSVPTERGLRDLHGITAADRAQVFETAINAEALCVLERVRDAAKGGSKTMVDLAGRLSQAMLADPETRFELCYASLVTKDGDLRKKPVTKPVAEKLDPSDLEALTDLGHLLLEAKDELLGFDALDRTRVLHDFASRFFARVEVEKAARGWLDFTDQILMARDLLSTRSTAQWVLWKLDGGIEHILVDEAQDTSQPQWDVVAALAGEFGAGEGARPGTRTLFVVGDRKQSIYSFQGADPAAFDRMRDVFGNMLAGGTPLRDHALRHSFRSSPAILKLVDRVFAAPSGLGEETQHIAFKDALPGRVDLWPHVPEPEKPAERDWSDPVDAPASDAANIVLARQVATEIRRMIDDGVPIEAGGVRRPVTEADILILFRSRSALYFATLAACKAQGLNLAGADRLRLADDLAVRDILALLRFAVTPEDDLSLAAVLRSPLCGLSEDDLYRVAAGRGDRTLLRSLRENGRFAPAVETLDDILAQADFLRPYEMIQRILVRHDGRRRLLGRLGAPVGEAIDGLLHQALDYEALEVPSLTGFLGWIDEADIEIKREATGGAIRVMSIHSAKGLEAPVVILPQCGARQTKSPPDLLRANGTVIWKPKSDDMNARLRAHGEEWQARQAEEEDRLLYVALTRAETWLICASAGGGHGKTDDAGAHPPGSWAERIRDALEAEGAVPLAHAGGSGWRLQTGDWESPGIVTTPKPSHAPVPVPWLEDQAPRPDLPARLANPSDLGGEKVSPGEFGDLLQRDDALLHGRRVHALLEHLPGVPEEDRKAAAQTLLDRHAPGLTDGRDDAMAEAASVLAAFPDLFEGTLAEVPFVLPAGDGRPGLSGTMDRVRVTPDTVHIVDFKTNRVVPDRPEDVPEGLLRQLGAYQAAGVAIWPGRTIRTSLLWTAVPSLMDIPAELVTAAWNRVPIDAGEGTA
ncbi:double-strand break repair helicase AddA [Jannaschia aquimarina]|uniref:DNA 3'-5' helicase n=1 Tax=Jannaschia aquimarina TaxID=935700 RepID=A0A0D1EEW8_9RHOB|nr:double-strand break repair helicase AddA [Jannaschia aquimarina]KIT15441.1 ATP-dependent helicase/nuclease subunit A [Jannaschia aquimarina]SNT22322.1 DNA helicase/exodeoxyribonuclease V, subunit A [Jannaschia aquimarina]